MAGVDTSNQPETPEELVARVNLALEDLRDSPARWWAYIVSHSTFELIVGDSCANDKNLVIHCATCNYIRGPVDWSPQRLQLSIIPSRYPADSLPAREWWYLLRDETVDFELEAASISAESNYNLLQDGGLLCAGSLNKQNQVDEQLQFRCPNCLHCSWGHFPYCRQCGVQLPDESALRKEGFVAPLPPAKHLRELGYQAFKNGWTPDSVKRED